MKWAEALVSRVCLAGKGPCPFPRRDDCKTACTYIAEVLDTTDQLFGQNREQVLFFLAKELRPAWIVGDDGDVFLQDALYALL